MAFGAAARGAFFTVAFGAGGGEAAVARTAGSEMRASADARRNRFTESPFGPRAFSRGFAFPYGRMARGFSESTGPGEG